MSSPTIDPLIRIKASDSLLTAVKYLVELEKKDISKDPSIIPPNGISLLSGLDDSTYKNFAFSVEDIKWIYARKEFIKSTQNNTSEDEGIDCIRNKSFHELISECEIILPQPKYPPRNPVLEARCQRLKAQQEEREYKRMTANVDGRVQGLHKHSDNDSFSKQMKELNNYLLIVLQLVVSLVCSFAFGYLAPYYFYHTTEVGPRLLSGIFVAFVVGLADLYFVLKFFLETEGVIEGDTIKAYDSSTTKHKSSKIKTN